jgi:hypothetical protein
MSKSFSLLSKALIIVSSTAAMFGDCTSLYGDASESKLDAAHQPKANFTKFTGKVVGKSVRLRTLPDLESFVVKELDKNELLVITEEKGDFYGVEPGSQTKAYVFRSFVLDNVVEGNRVNVRLFPDLEAPIIGHLNMGKRIDGKICDKNNKWLEIDPPAETKFYVAKEFVEYAGGPELKTLTDKRKATVSQLLESTSLLCQAEMRKPFEEITKDRIVKGFQTIINDYTDFPEMVEKAKEHLLSFNEKYLERKIAYLEVKAANAPSNSSTFTKDDAVMLTELEVQMNGTSPLTDRMKIWEPIEESLYLSWASMHRAKTIDDFYADQKLKSVTISGMLEAYADPVKNKPGDFVIKEKDVPVAYVYSTHINLHHLVGKRVNLVATERPNNSFAFPAYYVLEAE